MSTTSKYFALGGILAPLIFITAWVGCGLSTTGYSAVKNHISDLAASDSNTRVAMTLGFMGFIVGTTFFTFALSEYVSVPVSIAMGINTIGTLGVALFPVHSTPSIELLHKVGATISYGALAFAPLLAWRLYVAHAQVNLGIFSLVCGIIIAIGFCLSTGLTSYPGLFQRLGTSVGDVWMIVVALEILRKGARLV